MAMYRKETGASYSECLKMPYVRMIIESADFPQTDYDSKKGKNSKKKKQKLGFGTPIKDLPLDAQKQIR